MIFMPYIYYFIFIHSHPIYYDLLHKVFTLHLTAHDKSFPKKTTQEFIEIKKNN